MPSWGELEARAVARLPDRQEARWIVERVSGARGGDWLALRDDQAPGRVAPFLDGLIDRRLAGEPLQYVLGEWSFRRLDLAIDRRVLIPRPETEQVVEEAIRELAGVSAPRIVDLGTGSGAIALSLAVEVPLAEVWATDESSDALAVARANLAGIGGMAATRVRLVEGSWFDALPADLAGSFDLVISNPPYIAEHEVPDLDPSVTSWEPMGALVPGPTGLEDIEEIVAGAPGWLREVGVLVVEIDPSQSRAAVARAIDAGFTEVDVRPDLAGRPRTLVARR